MEIDYSKYSIPGADIPLNGQVNEDGKLKEQSPVNYVNARAKIQESLKVISKYCRSIESKNPDVPFSAGAFYKGTMEFLGDSERPMDKKEGVLDSFMGVFGKKELPATERMKKSLQAISEKSKNFKKKIDFARGATNSDIDEIEYNVESFEDIDVDKLSKKYTKEIKENIKDFMISASESGVQGLNLMIVYGALVGNVGCSIKDNVNLDPNDFLNTKNRDFKENIQKIMDKTIVGPEIKLEEKFKEGYDPSEAAFDSANALESTGSGYNSRTFEIGEFEVENAARVARKINEKLNEGSRDKLINKKSSGPRNTRH